MRGPSRAPAPSKECRASVRRRRAVFPRAARSRLSRAGTGSLDAMSDTRPSAPFDVVVLVGSAGATPVARSVLSALPADFPAAVVYVQHRAATQPLMLVDLLRRRVKMPVVAARDEQPIEPGVVHVAMPGQETRVEEGRFRIRDGRCLGDPLLAGV